MRGLQVAAGGEESSKGAVQGNGRGNILQVTSRTGAEMPMCFLEVVFYPALAPHGGDDPGDVLRSRGV